MLGATEIIIILIIAVLVLFGDKKKVSETARFLGRFSSEFKKGKKEVEKGIEGIKKEIKLK